MIQDKENLRPDHSSDEIFCERNLDFKALELI